MALASVSGAEAAPKSAPPVVIEQPSGPETIAYTHRKSPTLSAGYLENSIVTSPGLAGLLITLATGAAMDHISGSNTTKQYKLSDPSPDLARALAEALAARRGAIMALSPIELKGERPKAIAKAAGGARYVVDVRTLGWQVAGMSTKRSQYPSKYSASLNVIDGQSGVVAVQAICHWMSPMIRTSTGAGPEREKGEILRSHFATAGEVCLEQFKITMKSLYAPETHLATAAGPERREMWADASAKGSVEELSAPSIETRVAPPAAVAMGALPPVTATAPRAEDAAGSGEAMARALPYSRPERQPSNTAGPIATARIEAHDHAQDAALPAYQEYPYARDSEAPPSRTPPPEYRYAGRDANGYLVWPGKRP